MLTTTERSHQSWREEIEQEICWSLLERVLSSKQLCRANRLRDLLLYVGECSIRDGRDHLHEQEIGVRVFGRPDTYDNANDSIVRTTISELRKRIEAYFASDGREEPIVMEIPRGAYLPVFFRRELLPQQATGPHLESLLQPACNPEPVPGTLAAHNIWLHWISAAAIVALGAACLVLWFDVREAQRSIHPWQHEPAVASLWSGLLSGGKDTDVVMEDSSFLLVQLISKQNIPLSDYINKTYGGMPTITGMDPETDKHLLLISRKALGKASDFRLGLRIKELDPENPRLHFYNAREYTPRLLEKDNVVLLGTPTSNPWERWFESSLNFAEISAPEVGDDPLINRSPKPGEKALYTSSDKTVAYCAIAYLPKPDHSGNMLLIQGTTSEATEAGGEFLLSEDNLSALEQQLHLKRLPYFELLLNVSQVLGSPLTAKVEALRTYPNVH